jgi:mono/diheme cytochrome c family protein
VRRALLALTIMGAISALAVAQDASSPIASWSRAKAVPEIGATPAERGAAVFNNWCSACHGRDTERNNAPGTLSLRHKYRGELPPALEDRTDLTADLVRFYVRNGVATMPFFRPTEVSDEDLDALATYLASD